MNNIPTYPDYCYTTDIVNNKWELVFYTMLQKNSKNDYKIALVTITQQKFLKDIAEYQEGTIHYLFENSAIPAFEKMRYKEL